MATIRRPPLDNDKDLRVWLDRDLAGLVSKLNEERDLARLQAEDFSRRYALLVGV